MAVCPAGSRGCPRGMKNLDLLVHANALLPCLVVWFCLSVLKSAWAAVLLFEGLCLVGLPLLTLRLRDDARARRTAARAARNSATSETHLHTVAPSRAHDVLKK